MLEENPQPDVGLLNAPALWHSRRKAGVMNYLQLMIQPRSLPYNRAMSHLDILLPFSLPPPELSSDLLKEIHAPALAALLSRTRTENSVPRHENVDDFSRSLPHEIWLSRTFGLEHGGTSESSPGIAPALMRFCGLPSAPGLWFALQPVHIHIARDHLVLTDPRRLDLDEVDARQLFDIARSVFDEAGKTLIHSNFGMWFLRADDWAELHTASPDAASGHNIDLWMPKGRGERDWRKLQNEVQMEWFTHPLNAQRESAGLKSVNSVWLWGGAAGPASFSADAVRYDQVYNLHGWTRAFAMQAAHSDSLSDAADIPLAHAGRSLMLLDQLLEPALSNDWARWLDELHALEKAWFSPVLDALKAGNVDEVCLIATGETRLTRFSASRSSLRKFWVKPSLTPLSS